MMKLRYVWGTTLVLAVALSVFVSSSDTTAGEQRIIEGLQSSPVPGNALSNFFRAVTNTELDIVVGAVVVALLWWSGYRYAALAFAVLILVLIPTQHGLKVLVDRPRPPYDPDILWAEPTSPSFPSGHVMSATAVYGWLLYWVVSQWRCWKPRLVGGTVAATPILGTALTSMYLGVHWPTDVLGGYLWGLVLLLPAIRLTEVVRQVKAP